MTIDSFQNNSFRPTEKKKFRIAKMKAEKKRLNDQKLLDEADSYGKDCIIERMNREEREKNNLLPLFVQVDRFAATISFQHSEPMKSHSEKYIEVFQVAHEPLGLGNYSGGWCVTTIYKLMEKYRDFNLEGAK